MDIEWRFETFNFGQQVAVAGTCPDLNLSHACRVKLDSATDAAKAREIGKERVRIWLEGRASNPPKRDDLKALWHDMRAAKQYEFADRLRAILVGMKVDLNG